MSFIAAQPHHQKSANNFEESTVLDIEQGVGTYDLGGGLWFLLPLAKGVSTLRRGSSMATLVVDTTSAGLMMGTDELVVRFGEWPEVTTPL